MSDEKILALARDYKHKKDAKALFFKDKNLDPALRVEIPALTLEFTDGFYIGTDPEGSFHFNDGIKDLVKNQPKAKYTVESIPGGSEDVYLNIKFFHTDVEPGQGKPYAEFFAPDPLDMTAGSGLVGLTNKTGDWKKQVYSTNPATVSKGTGSRLVTIKSSVIPKTAEINTGDKFDHQRKRIKVEGMLYLKDNQAINDAHFAKWYTDHIVFYDDDYMGKEFSGFFFPSDTEKGADETDLGGEHGEVFKGVTWSNT